VAWLHGQQALECDEVSPWAHGTVLRTPSAPSHWDCNLLRVEHGSLDAAALMAAADELQAGLRHRKVEVDDEAGGARLRPEFAAAGWDTERLALMHRAGPPPAPPAGPVEVPYAATRDLRAEWYTGDDLGSAEEMRRFAASQEPIAARRGLRAFVLGDPPLAYVTLAQAGDAVEIDQLYVSPSHRGRGLGSTLVAAALAAGGTSAAWIEADDEDRPRALYERLGFTTVWIRYAFTRLPKR
jgi:ribosomal protein S18 acetylase RimI-like enzyme